MTCSPGSSFRYQALAAYWHSLVLMLVLVGRRVSARNKLADPQGYAEAQQMELWCRAVLGCLTQQICALEDAPAPEDPGEAHALAHLHFISTCLIALAWLAAKMKAELKAFSGGAVMAAPIALSLEFLAGAPLHYPPRYLDSS